MAVAGMASVALLSGTVVAADRAQADPATYLQAFNDTCRRGFPDLAVIARNAAAQGWQESTMRPVGGGPDPFAFIAARAFHRGGLTLFLTKLPDGEVARVCQITGPDTTTLTGADIAAAVSPSLNAGAPTPDRGKDRDAALWTVAPGITVHAGVAVYRKTRTISLSVSQAR